MTQYGQFVADVTTWTMSQIRSASYLGYAPDPGKSGLAVKTAVNERIARYVTLIDIRIYAHPNIVISFSEEFR